MTADKNYYSPNKNENDDEDIDADEKSDKFRKFKLLYDGKYLGCYLGIRRKVVARRAFSFITKKKNVLEANFTLVEIGRQRRYNYHGIWKPLDKPNTNLSGKQKYYSVEIKEVTVKSNPYAPLFVRGNTEIECEDLMTVII